ncbi:hypothetical protein GDO81_009315 [Engystomops pustulosus]|uniref:Uncharacterized protein n=1 Tax=Engystomops pustulosus TaxID=76066 RepID=A0AAV7BQZ6_ENGPU|nr:hypothetical protein GDO81_009315 [Engystomops pustulosus]
MSLNGDHSKRSCCSSPFLKINPGSEKFLYQPLEVRGEISEKSVGEGYRSRPFIFY